MQGISYSFMVLAVASGLLGMGWGIQMSASGDHSLSVAHAHLNLVGWVGMAVYAVYYHLVPAAAGTRLARVHLGLVVIGLGLLVPGIVLALTDQGATLAKVGSLITFLSMLLFLVIVVRNRVGG